MLKTLKCIIGYGFSFEYYEDGYDSGYEDGMKRGNARADEADRRAIEARQEIEEANRKVEILTRKLRGCSDEEIAAALDLSVEAVKECVSGALKDSE